jgi:hypothetical protein
MIFFLHTALLWAAVSGMAAAIELRKRGTGRSG